MSIVTDLQWIEEEKIADRMLLFAREWPSFSDRLLQHIQDPIRRALLGTELIEPSRSDSLQRDIRITQAWLASGKSMPLSFLEELEQRAEEHPVLKIAAARMYVLSCSQRELKARMALSKQSIPYIFPGEIAPLHIEMFAVGDRALHVLHVEWLKKLSMVAIEALELDCQNRAAWIFPFLEVLPEKELKRQIKKLARKRRYSGGGIGLLAFYGSKIGMNAEQILQRGDRYDELFYLVAKESERHHLA